MTAATIERPRKAKAHTKGQTEAKLIKLSELLHEASQTDGKNFSSGYSLRLLRVASEIARAAAPGADARTAEIQVNEAFDIAALVSASRQVKADLPFPAEMLDLIEHAHLLLNELTNVGDCFDEATPQGPKAVVENVSTPGSYWLNDPYMSLISARHVVIAARSLPELKHLAGFLDGVSALMNEAEDPVCELQGEAVSAENVAAARKTLSTAYGTLAMLRHTGESHSLLTAAEMLMDLAKDAFVKRFPEADHA